MKKFLMTDELNEVLPILLENAEREIIIVSPYLKINRLFKNLLETKNNEGVMIKILCAKRPDEMPLLSELENVDIRVHEKLHGKAYLNEQDAVISSMNMINFGESKNIEFGIYFSKNSEFVLFESIKTNIECCFSDCAKIRSLPFEGELKNIRNNRTLNSYSVNKGFCIRCRNEINFDMHKPLCVNCYASWSKYRNFSFNERYCHSCGDVNLYANFNRPLCRKCYAISDRRAA